MAMQSARQIGEQWQSASAATQQNGLHAGLLLRVSSPDQEEGYSLQDQQRDGVAYCERMGYRLATQHIWNDGAQKSYTLNRPGLQAAMEAVRRGEIQIVVVARYDRFSRIQIQQAIAIYQIEHLYGARVESADPKEQYGRDSTGTLLRNIAAWRAERELDLIRERTQGGRRSRALAGKLIPTLPLYGYVYADPDAKRGKTHYIVDPETAPIVQRIYQEIIAGISLRRIAQQLNQENVPTPAQVLAARGYTRRRLDRYGMWTRAMILRIATHPGYCGQYVAFRHMSTTQDELGADGKMRSVRHQRFRAEDDPARVALPADVCPAIVSEEVWERAREQLRVNRVEAQRNNRHGNEYLLRGGYAICGYCGHRMYAYLRSNKKQLVYRCGTATQYGAEACAGGSFTIQQTLLDEAVWKAIMWVFREPERIRAILDTQRHYQDDENEREEATRQALRAQLEEAYSQRANAQKAVLLAKNDQAVALWSTQVDSLTDQIGGLERELELAERGQESREAAMLYLRSIEEWSSALGDAMANASYEEKRFLIRGLKVKVTCYSTQHDPRYIIEFDLARLRDPLRQLLPRLTDKDLATYCDAAYV